MGGTVGFEFKRPYKLQVVFQQKTLRILIIQLLSYQVCMDRANFEALRASSVFETLPKEMHDFLNRIMSTTEEVA